MKAKKNIGLLYAIALLQGMVFYGPIAALYRQAAGVSVFQITLIESISLALCLALELPWGIVADRIGYKKTMLICCGLFFLSKIVFWRAEGFAAFLTERIMLSVAISGLSGVDVSLLYLSCPKEKFQKVFGVYNNLGTMGLLAASGVYALFVGQNYRLAGLLTVFSYALAALVALFLTEVKTPVERSARAESRTFISLLKRILARAPLICMLIGIALLSETHQTITVFLNQLQYVAGGISSKAIGLIYIGVTMTGFVGVYSHRITERLGAMPLAVGAYGLSALACAALSLTKNALLSVGAIAALRVGFSLFHPLQMELRNRQVASENRATELSVHSVIISGLGIGTNLVYGRLAQIGLAWAMAAGALFSLAGLALFCRGIERRGFCAFLRRTALKNGGGGGIIGKTDIDAH